MKSSPKRWRELATYQHDKSLIAAMSARNRTCIEDSITDTTVTASSKVTVSLNINRAWARKKQVGTESKCKCKYGQKGYFVLFVLVFTTREMIFLQFFLALQKLVYGSNSNVNIILLIFVSISRGTGRFNFTSKECDFWSIVTMTVWIKIHKMLELKNVTCWISWRVWCKTSLSI